MRLWSIDCWKSETGWNWNGMCKSSTASVKYKQFKQGTVLYCTVLQTNKQTAKT